VLLIARPGTMKRRFPLQIHISTIFLVLLLLVGGILGLELFLLGSPCL
jgi:cytochrome c biogenesis protein ResB